MFDQEQEHWDYEMGAQSEYQNAYAQSHMEADLSGDQSKIDAAIEAGLFAIVGYSTVYCPATDAFIGEAPYLCEVLDNYEEACMIVNERYVGDDVQVIPKREV